MKTDLLNLLKSSKIFSSLDDAVLRKLLHRFEKIYVPKGKVLFRQGELADCIYFLVSGKLAVFFKPEKKERKLINEILPGQTTGELSALSCGPRSATAKAVKKCCLLKLSSEEFITLCKDHTSVCIDVMNVALKQSRSSLKLMFDSKNIRKGIRILNNLIIALSLFFFATLFPFVMFARIFPSIIMIYFLIKYMTRTPTTNVEIIEIVRFVEVSLLSSGIRSAAEI